MRQGYSRCPSADATTREPRVRFATKVWETHRCATLVCATPRTTRWEVGGWRGRDKLRLMVRGSAKVIGNRWTNWRATPKVSIAFPKFQDCLTIQY